MSKIDFQDEDLAEFKIEAEELLEAGEKHLLKVDQGAPLSENYDAVFRAFHSIKGAAGMLGLEKLQDHLHQLETHFQSIKTLPQLSHEQITYFLSGIDASRRLLAGDTPTFEYTLPQGEKSPPPSSSTTSPLPQAADSQALFPGEDPPTIVAIDDEEDLLSVVEEMLKTAGFNAVTFSDPRKALQEIKTIKPEAVVTDMKMPNFSGLDVLREISSYNSDIPVLFLSGHLSKETLIEGIQNGVYGILEKPFDEKQLITLCWNAVKKYRLHRLLNRSINFMMYQLTDLEAYLEKSGQSEVVAHIRSEIKAILSSRRELKKLN